MAGFCRNWIPNFGLTAKPFYDTLRGTVTESLVWMGECQQAFTTLKTRLLSALALGLPDLKKEFMLYVHEWQGIALGVLIPMLETISCPVAYLSQQLDHMVNCCPHASEAVAAPCDL